MFRPTYWTITPRHELRLLGCLLITLHITLWWDFPNWVSRSALGVHFISFLLWQPLWGRQDSLSLKHMAILGIAILGFIAWLNYWTMTVWQILLLGLLSGRDLVKPRDRFVNMTAIVFVTMDLFIINLHQLFVFDGMPIFNYYPFDNELWFKYGALLIIPGIFLFIATDDSLEHRHHIDFFHGVTFCLLVIIIALGSLVIMYRGHISYPLAVFQMSLVMAVFILVISWLWMILAGQSGVGELWTRHLLNIGGSFEQWLANLAQPGHYKNLSPKQFLQSGLEQLVSLPWVSGIAWISLYGEGALGTKTDSQVTITAQSIEVVVYSPHRISGSHYFHVKLLVQLLELFHQARRREEAFAQQAHLQAIYETGAKLTHDIKNLLQSLQAIASAIESCQPSQFGDTQRMLQGQMPLLTQRLKSTLEKLQKPTEFSYSDVPVTLWWSNLKARYAKRNVSFISQIENEGILVPEDLFDNVVENLLQNALMKRKREPELQIEVSLTIKNRNLQLTVCDDGSPIPPEIAQNLLMQPVSSKDGFGIGLYQAAKQVAHTGYCLTVNANMLGHVCFELASATNH